MFSDECAQCLVLNVLNVFNVLSMFVLSLLVRVSVCANVSVNVDVRKCCH